ncbi:Protein of unknown function [Bacillus cereus]|nr:Protein of unknown function [Bacillus cereus]
MMTTTD